MKVNDVNVMPSHMQLINTIAEVAEGADKTVTAFRLERQFGVWVGETVEAARMNLIGVRALDGAAIPGSAYAALQQRVDSFDALDMINVVLTEEGERLAAAPANAVLRALWRSERQRCRLDLLCNTATPGGVTDAIRQELVWAYGTQTVDLGRGVEVRDGDMVEAASVARWLQRCPEVGRRVAVRLTHSGRQHVPLI